MVVDSAQRDSGENIRQENSSHFITAPVMCVMLFLFIFSLYKLFSAQKMCMTSVLYGLSHAYARTVCIVLNMYSELHGNYRCYLVSSAQYGWSCNFFYTVYGRLFVHIANFIFSLCEVDTMKLWGLKHLLNGNSQSHKQRTNRNLFSNTH